MYPDLQERVYDELKGVQLIEDTDVPYNDLANLKYMDMFIKETLRLFPSVPFLTRTVTSDIQLGIKGTFICDVQFLIYIFGDDRRRTRHPQRCGVRRRRSGDAPIGGQFQVGSDDF